MGIANRLLTSATPLCVVVHTHAPVAGLHLWVGLELSGYRRYQEEGLRDCRSTAECLEVGS